MHPVPVPWVLPAFIGASLGLSAATHYYVCCPLPSPVPHVCTILHLCTTNPPFFTIPAPVYPPVPCKDSACSPIALRRLPDPMRAISHARVSMDLSPPANYRCHYAGSDRSMRKRPVTISLTPSLSPSIFHFPLAIHCPLGM